MTQKRFDIFLAFAIMEKIDKEQHMLMWIIILGVSFVIFLILYAIMKSDNSAAEDQAFSARTDLADVNIDDNELDDIPSDELDDKINAMANIIGFKNEKMIRFVKSGGRINGIWVHHFPGNTSKKSLLTMYCVNEHNEKAISKSDTDRLYLAYSLGCYTINKCPDGGYNVIIT